MLQWYLLLTTVVITINTIRKIIITILGAQRCPWDVLADNQYRTEIPVISP